MIQLSRLMPKLAPICSRNLIRNVSTTTPLNRGKLVSYEEPVFGMASNLMRNLEQEFDLIRNRLVNRNSIFEDLWNTPALFPVLDPFQERNLIKTDNEGNRSFNLSLNLKEFSPEEVKVKTVGQNVVISAKTEKKSEDNYYLREFSQSFSLPADLKLADLQSKMSDDGFLVINAPLPKLSEIKEKTEKPIEIKHEKLDN